MEFAAFMFLASFGAFVCVAAYVMGSLLIETFKG